MKKMFLIFGIMIFGSLPLLAIDTQLQNQAKTSMGTVYLLLKIAGFGIVIWGVADMMQEEQGQGGGGKYIKAVIKFLVGSVFIAAQTIGDSVLGFNGTSKVG